MHSGTDKSVPYRIYNNASEPIFASSPDKGSLGCSAANKLFDKLEFILQKR